MALPQFSETHQGFIQCRVNPNMPSANKPRCPYCVVGEEFRAMQILENGRQICEHCGHITLPEDRAFRCPCQKCVGVHFSLKNARFFSIQPRFARD